MRKPRNTPALQTALAQLSGMEVIYCISDAQWQAKRVDQRLFIHNQSLAVH